MCGNHNSVSRYMQSNPVHLHTVFNQVLRSIACACADDCADERSRCRFAGIQSQGYTVCRPCVIKRMYPYTQVGTAGRNYLISCGPTASSWHWKNISCTIVGTAKQIGAIPTTGHCSTHLQLRRLRNLPLQVTPTSQRKDSDACVQRHIMKSSLGLRVSLLPR